jgi:hypothetical protein
MHFFDPNSGTWSPNLAAQVSILNKADEIANVLREITKVTQIKDVIVIAHSMGGLVGRAYLENMASSLNCYDYNGGSGGVPDYSNVFCNPQSNPYRGEIAQLITLDTPHGGADLAYFNDGFLNYIFPSCQIGPSTTYAEMTPGSPLLQNLNYFSSSIAPASPIPTEVKVQSLETYFSDLNPPWEAVANPLFFTTRNDGLISFDNQSMESSINAAYKNGGQFTDLSNPYTTESVITQTEQRRGMQCVAMSLAALSHPPCAENRH